LRKIRPVICYFFVALATAMCQRATREMRPRYEIIKEKQ
jgi:hypothetical protein